ncbi:16S rRNA (cytosine967-C5)-methyltransferase [Agrobacterium tumefaciens]|uniref:16S rRNA (Cytosine967-C5)-methyltransferase n=1 Tax=Agrobacterium radiobacter TaxID=362 RepID=A0ABR6JB67_AGRRD|nr:RsmB/NOP family class I SAM-dependent RNA methyltransferase [Agrobacterium radiobacter]TGE77800.1 MFS transporter [Rhizobium sp. SEMIA 439]MBB4282822.1 16S rRNA (cytosine967-C5)-methyltransferase [Agrobacterium radiobacter]MBB4320370.1 16S rRNA (cytosine967-C5)-methyltransferase [Agrobacterium radiobacter]MBB4324956.1 16S rRNA (cytosine967-C5)-methyltransferase [Agrobacterium radiobacter]MBB4336518.1 16S rRNA (cytosine967-C5)-methyltransferase [Agrobacterium radiobacter]
MTSDIQNKPARSRKPRPANGRGREDGPSSFQDKPGLAARIAATRILAAVLEKKTSLDGMLDNENGNPVYRALSLADRALVRAIVNSALRHLPRIETALSMLLDGPLPQGARSLHHVLVVGAAQMLYLDVPDHSAVDLAVEQAHRDPRNKRFVKLVNAVLRRLGREKAEIEKAVAEVPVLPDWFYARLVSAYGNEAAQRISQAQLTPSSIDLTIKADPALWAEKLGGTLMPNGSVRLGEFEGQILSLEGFAEGAWWVQDLAASMPVRLLGDISGKRVADLCAAPGGKTAQLALAGARVTALDQSGNRLRRLRENLDRLGLNAETVEANMLKYQPEQLFDAVLLDAPCSSTGTLRKHPDVCWTKDENDIAKLAALQGQMLRQALTLVGPGGLVVFSNCSLDPSEGEEMIAEVLAENPGVERVAVRREDWPGMEAAISADGDLRTTPDMFGGVDGFFSSVLRKK